MSNLRPAPIGEQVIETTGLMKKAWIEFVTGIFTGDTGTTFTPLATNLGISGTATLTGAYYRSGQFMDFYIYILPGASSNTTSTANSTYFQLPFDVRQDSGCFVMTSTNATVGAVVAENDRVYTPAWTSITTPITISGSVLGK